MRFCVFSLLFTFAYATKKKISDSTPAVQETCNWHNGGCAQICLTSQNGQVRCSCEPGFTISHRAKDCQDINECIERRNIPRVCEHDCTNIQGSFICSCKTGFELQPDGRSCRRKDRSSKRACASNCQHYCNSTTSSCDCFSGYRIHTDDRSCIRLCSNGNGGCEHICQETSEATFCSCRRSYVLQSDLLGCAGYSYEVLKVANFYNKFRRRRSVSCAVNNGGCIADCEDTPIGGQCSCPQGFVLQNDHRSCEDIDECAVNNGGCQHECRNNQGSYICSCPSGYKVHSNHTSCVDIDECLLNDTCQGECTNTEGGYECSCPSGYQLFSQVRCGDINECAVNNGGCAHICTNKIGDYSCSCRPGYKLLWNQKDCIRDMRCQNRLAKKFFSGYAKCKGKSKCAFTCNVSQKFQVVNPAIPTYEYTCGTAALKRKKKQRGKSLRLADTFPWQPPMLIINTTLPKCYNGNQFRFVSFRIKTDSCRLSTETNEILGNIASGRFSHVYFNYFSIKCVGSKSKSSAKKRSKPKLKLSVEMEVASLANNCNANCARKKANRDSRKIKVSIKKQQLQLRTLTQNLRVRRKTPPSERSTRALSAHNGCLLGRIPNPAHRMCSLCSRGYFFNITSSACWPCPPRTYQNKPGQLSCEHCPLKMVHFPPDPNSGPKTSAQQCQGLCQPGTYSIDGLRPPNGQLCRLCQKGTFQPYRGRIGCYSCPKSSTTATVGSSSFNDCKSRAKCTKGHFQHGRSCTRCPKGFYQPSSGKTYCYSCPGNTTTDYDASSKLLDCKQQNCGGVIGDKSGFIESPNYPGDYPINSHCQWELRAPKMRKFLFIIPEVYLPFGDTCGDILTMRIRKNPGPRGTGIIFNTCQTLTNPDPLPVKSKRVFIEFKSNHQNCSKGFQIPYVTYDENYDKIIQNIVKDGRLSAPNHFQDILKNKRLRRTLLTVLAEPKEYFDIIKQHQEKLFPKDFMVFLQRKVYEVFNYS